MVLWFYRSMSFFLSDRLCRIFEGSVLMCINTYQMIDVNISNLERERKLLKCHELEISGKAWSVFLRLHTTDIWDPTVLCCGLSRGL